MAKHTREFYRLPILSDGQLYKALSHSVEEDESLFVMNRNPPRPRRITSGVPQMTESGLRITNQTSADMRTHHVHYHPSGALIAKAQNNKILARVQAPPMPMLSSPFLMFHLSVAGIHQLAPDGRQPRTGDHAIDLSAMNINRLQIECWVGPKGCFDGPFQRMFGPAHRIVYRDAGFYDVAYFAGEGAPIDPSIEVDGVRLCETCITGAPAEHIVDPASLPSLSSEVWASPVAVARQLRAGFETRVAQFCSRLGQSSGSYGIRISLCSDGVIAGVDWSPINDSATLSSQHFVSLVCQDVMRMLQRTAAEEGENVVDVYDVNPSLSGGLPGIVFVRTKGKPIRKYHNALIFRGAELLAGRYWRIPPEALQNLGEVIDLIHSS